MCVGMHSKDTTYLCTGIYVLEHIKYNIRLKEIEIKMKLKNLVTQLENSGESPTMNGSSRR